MTCVIGLAQDGIVYMGGDSAVSDGWEVRQMAGEKICKIGDMLVGVTGTQRLMQLIQYHVQPGVHPEGMSDECYLVSIFLADVRRVLKEHGHTEIKDGVEGMDGALLIGYRGYLYCVGAHYQLTGYADGFDAIGSGREYALGAMIILHGVQPEQRIEAALKAAAYFCGSVCGPFVIRSIGGKA